MPARDDLRPLYVIGQGLSVGRSGEVLQVRDRERKVVQEARLHETSQVNLFGNVPLTAPALQALCAAEKPVAHFSSGGWFYGTTQGLGARNVYLRAEQFRLADDPVFCRAVASPDWSRRRSETSGRCSSATTSSRRATCWGN